MSVRLRRSVLAASLLGLTMIAGCTTVSQGTPRPTESSTGSGDEELPFAGAPKVDNPLDTSRYEQDPCKSLTSDQTTSLNLPATGTIDKRIALGIACDWFNPDTRGEATIAFLTDDPRGLSPEYDANDRGRWVYFEELPKIEGYPAVARAGTDDRDIGGCSVVVGVADDMVFESIVQLSQANIKHKDPCELAVQVAGMALKTMKAGA